jgi:hypothetical protein
METDKQYWHGYITEYEERVFSKLTNPTNILEFGVGRGGSIEWLTNRFPEAHIVGADILPMQDCWPRSDKISYYHIDQSQRLQIRSIFEDNHTSFDLIIEDGSHNPEHQVNCLVESIPWLNSGGYYILEDIHTSCTSRPPLNAYHLLLAFNHIRKALIPSKIDALLGKESYFSWQEIQYLFSNINTIHLYKRETLPSKCWSCQGNNFDYIELKCSCGEFLLPPNDSMAFILKKY